MTPEKLRDKVNAMATAIMEKNPGMRWSEACVRAKKKLRVTVGAEAVRSAFGITFDKQ